MAYDLLLSGARLVDPAHDVDGPRDVAVEDGRVAAVAERIDESEAARVVHLDGRLLVPGLIDTHVHVGGFGGRTRALGHAMVAETGVTTVLDMGSRMETVVEGMRASGAGLNVASLLSSAAAFDGDDPDEAAIEAAIGAELERGAFGLKIIGGHTPLTPDATARCVQVANRLGVHLGYHIGTTNSSSNLLGLRELPEILGDEGRLQLAHVAAYCRGMIEDPLSEVMEAIEILTALRGRVVSESYLSMLEGMGNATSGACDGDEVSDFVTRNCLSMRGYDPTRAALRRAMLDGYCSVLIERGGRVVAVGGAEAAEHWEAAGTAIGVSFPVTPPETAVSLMLARHEDGEFVVDALSTDGGGIPRNWLVERGLALVRLGALSVADYVRKASLTPARMLGLDRKGHLGVGADADMTVLDLERGRATMSLVAGAPIMVDGQVVGSGGTLLVTAAGEAAARASGLSHEVVDPSKGLMYRRA